MLAGWCADASSGIYAGTHNFNVYPSLYDWGWPSGMPWGLTDIAKVNWIFNNLEDFVVDPANLTQAEGDEIQDAIWYLLNSSTAGVYNGIAQAADPMGAYVPLPGGWAAAICIQDDDPYYQLIITIVDP